MPQPAPFSRNFQLFGYCRYISSVLAILASLSPSRLVLYQSIYLCVQRRRCKSEHIPLGCHVQARHCFCPVALELR